ncbi:hypothetical protein K438DRAFT_1768349 [Mycena galopus ATCC 62051]|nr:hypothetical protein K438DRAFT_1768349 [Mycena galopus ATCC 62051]
MIPNPVDVVKDNQEELRRLSIRLQHVMISIEESRQRNQTQPAEYEDALTSVAALVERSQLVTQKILKRSLGNRTWSRNDISSEIKRIIADLDTYLNVHVAKTLDIMHSTNTQALARLSTSVEEIMVKLAEIDIRLRTPDPSDDDKVDEADMSFARRATWESPGLQSDDWSPMIMSQAESNTLGPRFSELSTMLEMMKSESRSTGSVAPSLHIGRSLASSARVSIEVSGLKTPNGQIFEHAVTIANVNVGADYAEVLETIRRAGYVVPTDLTGEVMMITASDVDDFDATSTGGLKISMGTSILTWWCKYREYHGIAPRTTPGHTVTHLPESDVDGYTTAVQAGGVKIRFHRTLRVPDNLDTNRLPVDLGRFPLLPVSTFSNRLPENIKSRGGFFMVRSPPIITHRLNALFISFESAEYSRPAVKVSAGGVNVLTGIFQNVHDTQVREQDYIVPGLQPWIDGAMTEEGVLLTLAQFIAMSQGENYTIEEQITGKAEEGGFQFDIFPRRPMPRNGDFYEFNMQFETSRERATCGRWLETLKTPTECGVVSGATIGLLDTSKLAYLSNCWYCVADNACSRHWPPGGYTDGNWAWRKDCLQPQFSSQKIYKDEYSPRVYDEENGHRFHVHIIPADTWEMVTGVLPPITPISPETYKAHSLPWFTLSDSTFAALTPTTDLLGNLKTITYIDREKAIIERSQAQEAVEALIDPNCPPTCSIHMNLFAEVVFRPCGHTACSGCLGKAMLKRSRCPVCSQQIARFVGMKEPVAGVEEAGNVDEEGNLEPSWNIQLADIEQSEALAAQAVNQGRVVVIHLEEDRVAPLHSNTALPSVSRGW